MLRLTLLFSANLIFITALAQQLPMEWARIFKGQGKVPDRISAITTDASGNIYVAGYAGNHHGAPDAFAMKRSPQGDTLWVYYYDAGGNNDDFATDIVVDDSGNVYITGHSQTATSAFFECFTVKLLPSGVESWSARYSPGSNIQSYGNALAVDVSGNVYVAGYSKPLSASTDWLVIKYNASGGQQWVDVLNGPGNGDDEAVGIVIAPNGNPTVCGYTYSLNANGGFNAFVKQYTPSNGTAWTDTWNNPAFNSTDKAYGLGYNSSGDLYVGGETVNGGTSHRDVYARRYDALGNDLWTTIYTDATTVGDELLLKVTVDDIGNVLFAGTNYQDGVVTCIFSDGTLGWRNKWIGPVTNGGDVFHGITVDENGNVYAAGRGVYPGPNYYGNGGLPNLIITKYNAAGDSMWTYRCIDSLNCSMGFDITYRDGKIYAGGFVTDTAFVDENLYIVIVDTSGIAANEWSYNGPGDAITVGQLVQTDANNNVYCAATIDRLYYQGKDVAIIKYDPAGNLLWERYYSSLGWHNDTLTAMQFDVNGNLVLCISTDSALTNSKYKLSLLTVSQDGDFLNTAWYNESGNTFAKSMNISPDGSVAIATQSSVHGGLIVFFDPSHNVVWSAKIDSTQFSNTRANSLDFFPNGDVAVGGFSQVSTTSIGLVQRYNDSGALLWSTTIDSVGVYDEVRGIDVDSNGDVAFTGASGLNTTFAALVGKINGATGNLLWKQLYNPATNSETGLKVEFTPSGSIAFICRGWTGFVARYYTVQYSGTGAFEWGMVYSQVASDREPIDLLVENTGWVVTAGWFLSGTTTNHDYVLAGYNPSGTVAFINTYTTPAAPFFSWDELRDLTRDNQGNFIVTGQTAAEFYNEFLFKFLTIKYGGTVVGEQEIGVDQRKSVLVYPNPSTTGVFTMMDASPYAISSTKVFDINGRIVSFMDKGFDLVDLRQFPKGVYILVIERNNAVADHLRLVVQ